MSEQKLISGRIDPDADKPVGGARGLAYTIGNLRGSYGANLLVDAGGFCREPHGQSLQMDRWQLDLSTHLVMMQ
ncbi:MAG: hypothetical protein R2883_07910 [Caldisericia bacterium]